MTPGQKDILWSVSLFRGLPSEGLTHLAERGKPRVFAPDAVIMRQGDVSDSMHVIMRGHVAVTRSHPDLTRPIVLAELGPREVVGEMGVLDGAPRSATVTAVEETQTMELSRPALVETILRYPQVSGSLLKLLSERLRNTDELIEALITGEPWEGHAGPRTASVASFSGEVRSNPEASVTPGTLARVPAPAHGQRPPAKNTDNTEARR